MIIVQLMKAFPDSHFSIGSVTHSWEVCRLHGPLQSGMSKWLDEHDLTANFSDGFSGFVISWVRNPDREARRYHLMTQLADAGYKTLQQRKLWSSTELRDADKRFNEFIAVATECGLL